MSAAWVYLLLTTLGAVAVSAAVSRGRRPRRLGGLYFLLAWPVAELPLHHAGLSAAVTLGFAAAGALDPWPGRAGLAMLGLSWALLALLQFRALQAAGAIRRGLQEGLGVQPAAAPTAASPRWYRPFALHDPRRVERLRNISYGPAGRRNRLDVYRPRSGARGAPVLLQIHGGAWVFGRKDNQGLPLMNEMARRGWIAVAINYRLSPRATFPDHLVDCKLAIRWIRENVADYGGDPAFIAVTGGSAGGHLASLAALTANDPEYQPGFEDVDTSVAAAVPLYGAYDFLEHNGECVAAARRPGFVEKLVMKSSPREELEDWERASPIRRVHAAAPPFLVLHGTHDSLVWVEGGRSFVAALRQASLQPVVYAELPGAQHAFDMLNSLRCMHAVRGIAAFLEWVRANRG